MHVPQPSIGNFLPNVRDGSLIMLVFRFVLLTFVECNCLGTIDITLHRKQRLTNWGGWNYIMYYHLAGGKKNESYLEETRKIDIFSCGKEPLNI